MKKLFMVLAATVICVSMLMTSCSKNNIQPYTGVPLVILDADIGSSTDDLFTPSTIGNCRYQLPGDAAWAAAMLDRIRTFNKMRVNR